MDQINVKRAFLSPRAKVICLVCYVILTILYVFGIDTKDQTIYSLWKVFLIIGLMQRFLEWKEKSKPRL